MSTDCTLKVKYGWVIRLTENGGRPGERGDDVFIEQDVEGKPALQAIAGAIVRWI